MIKVGIVGTGDMGRIHADCLQSLKDDVKISACQDTIYDVAVKFSERYGAIPYMTAEELMNSDIDCVYICTRHDSHTGLVKLALKYNKSIFCEKPLAFTLGETKMLYEDVRKSSVNFTIGFNQRFAPAMLAMKKYIIENHINPTIINMSMSCVNFLDEWMGKPEQGGGIMPSWLCHGLDLLRHLTGDEISSLYCSADRLRLGEGYCEDCGAVICKMSSGTVATISFHDHSPVTYVMDPQKDMVRVEMHTGNKSLVSYGHDKFTVCDDKGVNTQQFGPYNQLYSWGYIEFNKQYIESLKKGESLEPGLRDAIISSILIDEARNSMNSQCAVDLKYEQYYL